MKIILNQDVQNLGEEGDIREVARGYARNYLIPKGLGVAYSKQNLALLAGKRKAIEKRKDEKRTHAAGVKERIEALDLQIPMTVGETGRLFGSVTNTMLAEELSKLGIEVERKKIEIPEHTIKMTGNFVVKIRLYGSEVASLKVTVTGPKGSEKNAATEAEPVPPEDAVETKSPEEVVEGESAAEVDTTPTSPEEVEAEPSAEADTAEETADEQDANDEDDAEERTADDDEEPTERD